MTVPEVTVPDVTVPEVTVPEVTVPEVTVIASFLEVTVPEVTAPEVTVLEVTVPEVTVPEVTWYPEYSSLEILFQPFNPSPMNPNTSPPPQLFPRSPRVEPGCEEFRLVLLLGCDAS